MSFAIFTFLNQNWRKVDITGRISWDESCISQHCFPRHLHWPLPTSSFLSTSEGNLSGVPVWHSELNSLWRTLCIPQRPFFILNSKDLNFLADISLYVCRLLRTTVITTSARGSRRTRVLLVSPVFIHFHFNFLSNSTFLFHLAKTFSVSLISSSLAIPQSVADRVFTL